MEQKKQIEKDFEKVIGYEPIKLVLERILDMIRNREKYDKLGAKLPSGILLSGKPGIGKTLIANSFIEASKLPVYLIRKDKPDGDFIKFIKQSFEDAKSNAPSIVFLDDMDKLPRSLCRSGRFDKQIKVSVPRGKDATQIIEYYMKQKNFVSDVNSEEIAKMLDGGSCAVLETVINEASILAGFAGKDKIEKDDLLRSAMCVIFEAPEIADKKPIEILKKTAYHEAGHAVIAELLEPESISLVSVLGHDGPTQGVTAYYQDDDTYFSSIEYMKNRVKSLLAGKAATEIVYGEVDVGANNDIHRAISITERFVDHYCGFGFDKFEFQKNSSNDLLSRKETIVFSELEKYYQEVKKMLISNREFLDKVAQQLVVKETLTCKDLKKIKETCQVIK